MIAAALDVDRPEVFHFREAARVDGGLPTNARIANARLRDLKEDAAERVVDLLVVPVLPLVGEPPKQRTEADRLEEVGVAEREVERNDELDVATVPDLDPLGLEGVELLA